MLFHTKKIKKFFAVMLCALCFTAFAVSVCAINVSVSVSSAGSSIDIEISPDDTVWTLKQALQGKTGVSAVKQIIMYAGNPLVDDKTMEDYGITDGAHFTMKLSDTDTIGNEKEETTAPLTPDDIEADGKIIIGSLIVNSSNIRVVSYVTAAVVAGVVITLIVLKRRS